MCDNAADDFVLAIKLVPDLLITSNVDDDQRLPPPAPPIMPLRRCHPLSFQQPP